MGFKIEVTAGAAAAGFLSLLPFPCPFPFFLLLGEGLRPPPPCLSLQVSPSLQVPAAKKARPAAVDERRQAAAEGEAGPLAAATEPEERRRLKRAAERPASGSAEFWPASPAAAEARAACSSVSVAASVFAWGRSSGSSDGAGSQVAAPALRTAGSAAGVQGVSEQLVPVQFVQCALLCVPPSPVPPVGHMPMRLGRSGLWCLSCYGKPAGNYRVWLRGRCSELRPPAAAPAGLSAALLRSGPLDADASEPLRIRHALLVAAARVVPVLPAARPQEAGGRQVEEH